MLRLLALVLASILVVGCARRVHPRDPGSVEASELQETPRRKPRRTSHRRALNGGQISGIVLLGAGGGMVVGGFGLAAMSSMAEGHRDAPNTAVLAVMGIGAFVGLVGLCTLLASAPDAPPAGVSNTGVPLFSF